MRQILAGLSSFYNRFGNLPFVGILIIIAVFIWINGGALFPESYPNEWDETYGRLFVYYFIMILVFFAFAIKRKEEIHTPLWLAGRAFGIFAIGTWGLMEIFIISGLYPVPEFPVDLFWQTILLQICVVACCEELMFRGVLLRLLEHNFKSIAIAVVGSAIAFAVWHIYAYQIILHKADWGTFDWFTLLFAFSMGLLLAVIAINEQWGLGAAIAVHGTVNLMILGVLVL